MFLGLGFDLWKCWICYYFCVYSSGQEGMERYQRAPMSSDRGEVPISSPACTRDSLADYYESLMDEETDTEAATALPTDGPDDGNYHFFHMIANAAPGELAAAFWAALF
jgi:hypothetical protein